MESRMMTVQEVARRLRVSPQHVYSLVKSRRLPNVRVGVTIRFSEPAIEAWINAGGDIEAIAETKPQTEKPSLGRAPGLKKGALL